MKVVVALVAAVVALPLAAVVGLGALLGGGGPSAPSGPPANLGAIVAPAKVVALDAQVAAAGPSEVPCHVPEAILLAQQWDESAFNASAVSPHGRGVGLAQFSSSTFAEYDRPAPPGGAVPPTRIDLVDSAFAEARYLCSLGVATDPTAALIGYNCGSDSPTCQVLSGGYATRILAVAQRIATPTNRSTTADG